MNANTLFLRAEGPLQAWGVQESKFVVRRTAVAPTKSGVIGMLCAALGVPRDQVGEKWLPKLNDLRMGVRVDRPGVRWWDYHTVGAGMKMRIAKGAGEVREGAMLTRREYLCDASFLVALLGEPLLIAELAGAMKEPRWTLYLGRKSCPPSRPLMEHPPGVFQDLVSALKSVQWQPRFEATAAPQTADCLLDWVATPEQPDAPADAVIWYDVPLTFEPPAHAPRFVIRTQLQVGAGGEVTVSQKPSQNATPAPQRPRADYGSAEYKKRRSMRLEADHHLCVFCKSPAGTVQHVTYRHAGGGEQLEELRSLCRLCHDAVTMIEYGLGMGLDRINPEEPRWRDQIIRKRDEIIRFRSLATRRRRLQPQEVE